MASDAVRKAAQARIARQRASRGSGGARASSRWASACLVCVGLALAAIAVLLAAAYVFSHQLNSIVNVTTEVQVQPMRSFTGPLTRNNVLDQATRAYEDKLIKPESLVQHPETRWLYTGTEDGVIWRFPPFVDAQPSGEPEQFLRLDGGRPLALLFEPRTGDLLVADANLGLLRVSMDTKQVQVLSNSCGGVPNRFTDDLDVDQDGNIYYSDASRKWSIRDGFGMDLLEGRAYGRLCRYVPATGQTDLVVPNLYFANGVAVARPSSKFVLVAESAAMRVMRHWIRGPHVDETMVFASNTPCLIDNLWATDDGHFWAACPGPRSLLTDTLLRSPFVRRICLPFQRRLFALVKPYGLLLKYNSRGEIVQSLHGPAGVVRRLASVTETPEGLYLGTVAENWVGFLPRSAYDGDRSELV